MAVAQLFSVPTQDLASFTVLLRFLMTDRWVSRQMPHGSHGSWSSLRICLKNGYPLSHGSMIMFFVNVDMWVAYTSRGAKMMGHAKDSL
jgi:hypothetical protein